MTNCFELRRHVNRTYLSPNYIQKLKPYLLKRIEDPSKSSLHIRHQGNPYKLKKVTRDMQTSLDLLVGNDYFGHQRVTNGLLGVNRLDETHKEDLIIEGTILNVSFGFNHLTTLFKEHLLDDLLFHDIEENNL